jgi:hypothetical protein
MWFRYYHPRLGRFMSADPLSGSIDDPQSLNWFAYVRNMPMSSVDMFGLCDLFYPVFYEFNGEKFANYICFSMRL